MDDIEREALKRHVAGAMTAHKTPFDDLITSENQEDLDRDFINKFVIPFYMNFGVLEHRKDELKEQLKAVFNEINADVVAQLLGDFNWRTRSVGAFFAALKDLTEFQDQIGRLLLKSEVCYAGKSYCLALTEYNNQKSIDYLNQYLGYYLTQKNLWFDQSDAMGAIAYLDKQNGTNELKQHLEKWTDFVSNKRTWDLDESIDHFAKNITALKELKNTNQHRG